MGMGKPSKLSEEQWEALFGMDRAGVRRADLAGWYGITVGTICWQARKRGRMKGGDPLAVDRRRRPFGNAKYPPDLVVADFRELADLLTGATR